MYGYCHIPAYGGLRYNRQQLIYIKNFPRGEGGPAKPVDEVQPPLKGEVVCEADRRGSDAKSNMGGNDNVLPIWGIQKE